MTERRIVFLLSAVQFVQIMDFTMMLPLGPDLSKPFAIPASFLPLLVAIHMCAATMMGFVCALYLKHIERDKALIIAMAGLAIADCICATATGLIWFVLGRFLAGACGGLATSQGLTILADIIPESRRGRAVGTVLRGNDISSLIGVPLGLWLSHAVGWQAPFQLVAMVAAILALGLLKGLSAKTSIPSRQSTGSIVALLRQPSILLSYAMTFLVAMSTFLIIPNLSAFIQYNLGLPRSEVTVLYALAGGVNFMLMSQIGRAVDKYSSFKVATIAILLFSAFIIIFIIQAPELFAMPITVSMIVLLISLSSRNVAVRTLTTKVPAPEERGKFMALQSAVQQIAAVIGAISSSVILETATDGQLVGMPTVGYISIAISLLTLLLLARVEKNLLHQKS